MTGATALTRARLDTDPLTDRIRRRDLRAFRREFRRAHPEAEGIGVKARTFLMLFLTWDCVLALAAFGGIIAETLQEGAPDAGVQVLFQALIASIFAILLVVFGSWAIRSRERRGGCRVHYRLVRFAAANGMTYLPGPMSDGRFGSARRYFDLTRVMRPTRAPGVEYGNHEIVTAGRREGAPRFGGYAMIRLAHEMPHIRVIVRRGILRRALTMMSRPEREQRLALEGDFDRHYALYCPAGSERDALYLFTPDILALLIDRVRGLDVEVVGDRLLLTSFDDVVTRDPERWRDVIEATTALVAKVDRWERWRADPIERPEDPSALDAVVEALGLPDTARASRPRSVRRLRMTPTLGGVIAFGVPILLFVAGWIAVLVSG
ncbi:hypothetical protein HA387_06135 [Clavibacter michiganensis subsp. michiganensis]|uniref:hypothetical protein n=1 Tax=Clavibacter michiganensis TaxID=28447 RepID=UPI00186808D7|nr:hypothetical protein [Clavibacter michiganensis]MBE3077999.1 hypothetical protein [Clavibacter michiganensis subsp. michiganensis]